MTVMRSRASFLVLFGIALCLAGCASDIRYRTDVAISDSLACQADESDPKHCEKASTEIHQVPGLNGSSSTSYTLHFVEFDDEGAPHEGAILGAKIDPSPDDKPTSQINAALRQIREVLSDSTQCVQLVVFTHGWQNNAAYDNGNVVSFREFLKRVAQVDSLGPVDSSACFGARKLAPTGCVAAAAKPCVAARLAVHRNVIGIYVGWRGQTLTWPVVEYATFWDRKAAAERVARGSIRELFGRLRDLAELSETGSVYADSGQPAPRLRTYVIGHSFGADAVYQSLAQSLIDSLVAGLDDASGSPAVAPRFIDMVVLVNPAVEAQRFDPVFRAAKQRAPVCDNASPQVCTAAYQAPLLAIFTSENDRATEIAFPIGRWFSTVLVHPTGEREGQAVRETVGWNDDFVTHHLEVANDCGSVNSQPYRDVGSVKAYLASPWQLCTTNTYVNLTGAQAYDASTGSGAKAFLLSQGGGSLPGARYNGPIWNVRVSQEMIDGHNGIWRADFADYLLTLFTDEVAHTFQ